MRLAPHAALFLIAMIALALGCASTPEAKLNQAYDAVSQTVKATTILNDRGQISIDDAKRVRTMAQTTRQTLDAAAEALRQCRETVSPQHCRSASLNITLGSRVLQDLETYLKEQEK